MARQRSLQNRINGMTNAYLGNTRTRSIAAGAGNRLATHAQNYRFLRRSMGMSAG